MQLYIYTNPTKSMSCSQFALAKPQKTITFSTLFESGEMTKLDADKLSTFPRSDGFSQPNPTSLQSCLLARHIIAALPQDWNVEVHLNFLIESTLVMSEGTSFNELLTITVLSRNIIGLHIFLKVKHILHKKS